MTKTLVLLLALLNFNAVLFAQNSFRVHGKVMDFHSNSIGAVAVIIKDKNFKDLYSAITDKDGKYSMQVSEGAYNCLYAIKPDEYGITKLEYWAWNIPVFEDIEINPQYDKMEIYGMHAFEPRVSPYETYMVYFRPMSLNKSLKLATNENKKAFEKKAMENHDTIKIAPENITPDELEIKINEERAKVLTVQKITEYARGAYLYGYVVQILKPLEEKNNSKKFDKITIVLHSKETGEYGKGDLFISNGK